MKLFFLGIILLSSGIMIVFNIMHVNGQNSEPPFEIKDNTTGEILTQSQAIPNPHLVLSISGQTKNTTVIYSDRFGRPDSNDDWNVFLRTTITNGINSTKGIELGGDTIFVNQMKLPISKEITITSELLSSQGKIPQKVRYQPDPNLGYSDTETPMPVTDFLNNNIDLLNTYTNSRLTHYVFIHSVNDAYADKVLAIPGQFVTTIAFDDRYGSAGDDGSLNVFIQISHTRDKVTSFRAIQLGEDDIKMTIGGQDKGIIAKSAKIEASNLSTKVSNLSTGFNKGPPKTFFLELDPHLNQTAINQIVAYYNTFARPGDFAWTFSGGKGAPANYSALNTINNVYHLNSQQCNPSASSSLWITDATIGTPGFTRILTDGSVYDVENVATFKEANYHLCGNHDGGQAKAASDVIGHKYYFACTPTMGILQSNLTNQTSPIDQMGSYCDIIVIQMPADKSRFGLGKNPGNDGSLSYHDLFYKYATEAKKAGLKVTPANHPLVFAQIQTNIDCLPIGRTAPCYPSHNVSEISGVKLANQIQDVADGFVFYYFHENDTVVNGAKYFKPGFIGDTIQSPDPLPLMQRFFEATNLVPSPSP